MNRLTIEARSLKSAREIEAALQGFDRGDGPARVEYDGQSYTLEASPSND